MNPGRANKPCTEIAPLLVFYVCDEVDDQERAAIEQHLAGCAACQAHLTEEREFQGHICSVPRAEEQLDPAGILLAQCRSELAEKIDDLERPAAKQKVATFGWFRGWMSLHPAWSAASLILVGLVAGTQYSQWSSARSDVSAQDQTVSVHPSPQITEDQLKNL